MVVEFLISAIRLSRPLPKFIGDAQYPFQRVFAFSAPINRSFRNIRFGASFIDYCHAPAVFDRDLQPKDNQADPAVLSLRS